MIADEINANAKDSIYEFMDKVINFDCMHVRNVFPTYPTSTGRLLLLKDHILSCMEQRCWVRCVSSPHGQGNLIISAIAVDISDLKKRLSFCQQARGQVLKQEEKQLRRTLKKGTLAEEDPSDAKHTHTHARMKAEKR